MVSDFAYKVSSIQMMRALFRMGCIVAAVLAVHSVFAHSAYAAEAASLVPAYVPSPLPTQAEFDTISAAARNGDPESQLHMGVFYANGDVVEQNLHVAREWFHKAAEQGDPRAQRNLAVLYDYGLGGERNYREAARWYFAAANRSDPAAHVGIAGLLFSNRQSAFPDTFVWPVYESSGIIMRGEHVPFGKYDAWLMKAHVLNRTPRGELDNDLFFWQKYGRGSTYYMNQTMIHEQVFDRAKQRDPEAVFSAALFILGAKVGWWKKNAMFPHENFVDLLIEAADLKNPYACFILAQILRDIADDRKTEFDQLFLLKNKYLLYAKMAGQSNTEMFFEYDMYCMLDSLINRRGMIPRNYFYEEFSEAMLSLAYRGYPPARHNHFVRFSLMHWKDKELLQVALDRHDDSAIIDESLAVWEGFAMFFIDEPGLYTWDPTIPSPYNEELENSFRTISRMLTKSNVNEGYIYYCITWLRRHNSENYPRILSWYRAKAKRGDPDAQAALGVFYDESRESDKAMYCFSKAAQNHHPYALYKISDVIEGKIRIENNRRQTPSSDRWIFAVTTVDQKEILETINRSLLFRAAWLGYFPAKYKLLEHRRDLKTVEFIESYEHCLEAVTSDPEWYLYIGREQWAGILPD